MGNPTFSPIVFPHSKKTGEDVTVRGFWGSGDFRRPRGSFGGFGFEAVASISFFRSGPSDEAAIPEGSEAEGVPATRLDKNFGFSKHFGSKCELREAILVIPAQPSSRKGNSKDNKLLLRLYPKRR
ncbi:hypothetical protein SLEP1_g23902 [Rubroshorea leprosula]|uniref:Uncharacterized protein n=1 Tax=Rubroshorea leprosula TaxID=152421 RepID=A0AAV5JJ32_9ROSI|nr:hypothetical protein SLEP1_g23902 [Rubroshorea leprosula]